MSWDEADPVTTALLIALDGFAVSREHKLQALRSAAEAIVAMDELETQLEQTAEYQIAGAAIMKIRDRA
ncbi:MAG TPA: hypothetical protein VJ999_11430 [Candidatus Sulfotelmatobacter sp.]|nr:hypothetical protein [Candidatus Sulfotelmatobacter sp.]